MCVPAGSASKDELLHPIHSICNSPPLSTLPSERITLRESISASYQFSTSPQLYFRLLLSLLLQLPRGTRRSIPSYRERVTVLNKEHSIQRKTRNRSPPPPLSNRIRGLIDHIPATALVPFGNPCQSCSPSFSPAHSPQPSVCRVAVKRLPEVEEPQWIRTCLLRVWQR